MSDGGSFPIHRDVFRRADELMRICRTAVRGVLEEHRRLGVANVYSFNGERYFELLSGNFSRTPPQPDDGNEA